MADGAISIRHQRRRATPFDAKRNKRRRAILHAYEKHKRARSYTVNICRELQQQRVKMPERWLPEWQKLGFRVEPSNWFDAYQGSGEAKSRIQKYISKIINGPKKG